MSQNPADIISYVTTEEKLGINKTKVVVTLL